MKRFTFLLAAVATLAGVVALTANATRYTSEDPAPVFVTRFLKDTATGDLSLWPTKKATSTTSAPFWETM